MRFRGLTLKGRLPWAGLLALVAASVMAFGIALAAQPAVAPPAILSHPADPTNQTSASFTYSDSQAGVTYQCQVDAAGYTACPSTGASFTGPLGQGTHTFAVRAVSGTKTSTPTAFTWLV